MVGPARTISLRLCQKTNKPARQPFVANPNCAHVDVDRVVADIENEGYAHIGQLPANYVDEIKSYCEKNDQASYWNPHQNCEAMERIARNPILLEIARKYLGAEPRLWLTQLRWTYTAKKRQKRTAELQGKSSAEYNFHDFHYDSHDFRSVTIFVYLTDVAKESGPHMFIRGTHKEKTLGEIVNISISDDEAERLYGDRIQVVLGPKGTVFAEDTSCYHKAAFCEKENRLLASFDYVIRKKAPPLAEGLFF